jgi:hypothetical protein
MANQTNDSGFHQRVHRGHFENFLRKLTAAESREQRERVISSIEVAVARDMIDAYDHQALTEVVQRRRNELNRQDREYDDFPSHAAKWNSNL